MSIIGTIIGDIAGSRYEFMNLARKDIDPATAEMFTDKHRATDDSYMTIATKLAVLENPAKPDFTKWYHYVGNEYPQGGYGEMFTKWLADSNPQPYGSYGNGSAMRVSYVGEYYETIDEVIQHARESAQVTHNHPQGVKGAIVTAVAVFMAKHGSTKEEIFNYVNNFYSDEEVYKYPTWMSLDEMRKIYRWDVSCQGSVPAAFRCIYEANSYEEFIRNVYSLPCDRDTLCAIGGSVAEELFGLGDINKDEILNKYLDDRCIDWINN